ncbi:MAG: MmcQ/YjbR family DNA-binding protein [Alphaproteobacteria bacterium]|nr:MmcQ/YjbR family DNA-binding protein [Alphaproteobacteria bacterium]
MTEVEFRALALSFPETVAATSHGQSSYKSFGKFLTRLRSEDDSIVLGEVDFDERELLCKEEPATFHFTDHYRGYRYVLARLGPMDEARARAYLTRQWRKSAPKRWLKAWDAER